MSTLDFVELKLDEAGISYKTNLEENGEKKKTDHFLEIKQQCQY